MDAQGSHAETHSNEENVRASEGDPQQYRLHFDPQGAAARGHARLRERRLRRALRLAPEDTRAFYAPYDASSTYLAVADSTGLVVAMARYIYPSPPGLSTLDELARGALGRRRPTRLPARPGWTSARTWDLSAASASARAPGGYGVLHAAALYHGLIKASAANDVRGLRGH